MLPPRWIKRVRTPVMPDALSHRQSKQSFIRKGEVDVWQFSKSQLGDKKKYPYSVTQFVNTSLVSSDKRFSEVEMSLSAKRGDDPSLRCWGRTLAERVFSLREVRRSSSRTQIQLKKKIITSSVVTTTWNPEKGWRHRPMKSRMASPGRGKSLLQKRGHMAHWERSSVMCQLLFCGASRYLARCFLPVDGAERERRSGFSTVRRARNLTRGRGAQNDRLRRDGWISSRRRRDSAPSAYVLPGTEGVKKRGKVGAER